MLEYIWDMPYEVLDSTENNYRSAVGPMFQLRPDGVMRFNVAAAQELRKLGAERALVLWDKAKHKIAFSAAPPEERRSYKVAYNRKGNGAQLVARTFPRYIGLTVEAPIRISVHLNGKLLEGEIGPEFISPTGALLDARALKTGSSASKEKQPAHGEKQ